MYSRRIIGGWTVRKDRIIQSHGKAKEVHDRQATRISIHGCVSKKAKILVHSQKTPPLQPLSDEQRIVQIRT